MLDELRESVADWALCVDDLCKYSYSSGEKREALQGNVVRGSARERLWKECKRVVLLPHYITRQLNCDRKGSAADQSPSEAKVTAQYKRRLVRGRGQTWLLSSSREVRPSSLLDERKAARGISEA